MRRQWPCSKCGFACSSTWRSMNPTKPVVCNSCKSKANSSKSGATSSSKQAEVTETTNPPTNPMSYYIKPSTLLIKENNPDKKMDSGFFVFGEDRSDPFRVDQEPTSKGKGKAVARGDGQSSVGIEDHFHTGLTLKSPSTLFEHDIHEEINEDAAKKLVLEEIEKLSFWNADTVKKKKRTKLPQFTPSPTERFFNQLYHISKEQEIMNTSFPNKQENPLYDDLFIYQKCNFIPENEIGLGTMLLPDSPKEVSQPRSTTVANLVVKQEPLEITDPESTAKDKEVASCMIEVKKISSEEVVRGEESPSFHMNSTSREPEPPPARCSRLLCCSSTVVQQVYKSLNELYAHTGGENSTGVGGRPQGRPPRGTGPKNSGGQRNFDKILQLDSSSLVDVPFTYSFDENTTDIRSTEAGGVEILAADVETMTSVSIPE